MEIILIVGGVFIAIFVLSMIVSAVRNEKNQNSEQQTETQTRVEKPSPQVQAFKHAQNNRKSANVATAKPVATSGITVRKMEPRIKLSNNTSSSFKKDYGHTHPTDPNAEYRVEKVDMGNFVGEITEGCPEQYFQRIIKINKKQETDEPNYDAIKAIVFGEVLGNPKFKKYL